MIDLIYLKFCGAVTFIAKPLCGKEKKLELKIGWFKGEEKGWMGERNRIQEKGKKYSKKKHKKGKEEIH